MNLTQASPWGATTRTLTETPDGAFNSEGANITATTAAVQGTMGAFVTVVAALAHTCRGVVLFLNMGTVKAGRLRVAVGAAGLEVTVMDIFMPGGTFQLQIAGMFVPVSQLAIAKGTRVSVAVANDQDASAQPWSVACTVIEAND